MTLPYLTHPGGAALHRFADNVLDDSEHSRVAAHLAGCPECRATVAFHREVRDQLHSAPLPHAPESIIERVIAERASGARSIIPVSDDRARPRRVPVGIAATVAAVAAVFIIAAVMYSVRTTAPIAMDVQASDSARSIGSFMFPVAAFAAAVPPRPVAPPVVLTEPHWQAMHLEYAELRGDSTGRMQRRSRETLDVSSTHIEGADAWQIVQLGHRADTTEAESLYVDRTSLRVLGRSLRVAPYQQHRDIVIRQRLLGDRLVGWMETSDGLGRPIDRTVPHTSVPIVTDALAPIFLSATTLSSSWRGSVSLLGWAVRPEDVALPITLVVTGGELVSVPAGKFDCWKLTMTMPRSTALYWVRKTDGIGIRVLEGTGRAEREIVLEREKRQAP